MGLSLKFVTGPANEILSAMKAADYQALDHLTALQADFSLHLQPRDLQTLSDCAGKYAVEPLPPFRSSLTCYLDEADRGFFLVGPDWADGFASIAPESCGKLAEDWFAGMAERYPEENVGRLHRRRSGRSGTFWRCAGRPNAWTLWSCIFGWPEEKRRNPSGPRRFFMYPALPFRPFRRTPGPRRGR